MPKESGFRIAPKSRKNDNGVTICQHDVKVKSFLTLFYFFLSGLITGPSFTSISLLILELWQFSFIRDWPEIRKSEIPLSEFCATYEDWSELGIPKLARISLMKPKIFAETECLYWMLQNARIQLLPFLSY